MNEKISKIKLELLKEEFTKQIKDSYILNLSMILLDEFEKLKTENKQLKENYDRIYNENCILREKHNINDIGLLDENYKLKKVIDKAIKFIEDTYYSKNTTDIDSIVLSSDKLIKVKEILKEVE